MPLGAIKQPILQRLAISAYMYYKP